MVSKRKLNEELRAKYLRKIADFLTANDEEALLVGSNELAVPCVDGEGNDEFIVITLKVPTGSRDGEPYDGYAMRDNYAFHLKEKEQKAKEAAERKAQKIERDKAMRAAKQKAREG